jgi:hypothetical protein
VGFAKWHLIGHVGENVVLVQRGGFLREGVLKAIDTAAAVDGETEHSIAVVEIPPVPGGAPWTVLIALEAIDSCQVAGP